MIAVNGLIEGFDFLADLGVDTAANCDRGVEMTDLLGLAIQPGMNDRPAFMSVVLFLLEIFSYPLHALLNATISSFEVISRLPFFHAMRITGTNHPGVVLSRKSVMREVSR